MKALDDIEARADEALLHQNLDPSVHADMAWSAVADIPKLIAALEAVEKLAKEWQKTPKKPTTFDAALHHASMKIQTVLMEIGR